MAGALREPRAGLVGAHSRRREGGDTRYRPLADVVDARVHDALALDLDEDRGLEVGAIELPEHQGKIGALGLPVGHEVGSELDRGRYIGTAYGEAPRPPYGRGLAPSRLLLGRKLLGGLCQAEAPIIEHIALVRRANPAGEMVELGILVRMQAHHFD